MENVELSSKPSRTWTALAPTRRIRPIEWLVENLMLLVSASAILLIFLIFLFVAREALPVLFGRTNSALVQPVLQVQDMNRLTREQLREYLGLTKNQFAAMDPETMKLLVEVK